MMVKYVTYLNDELLHNSMWAIISCRTTKTPHGTMLDQMEREYIEYYEQFGLQFIPLPTTTKNFEKYFALRDHDGTPAIKRIILTGGNDVHPDFYGGSLDLQKGWDKDRDTVEFRMIEYAMQHNIPLLAICRGMQALVVHFGGTLTQDIKPVVVAHYPADWEKPHVRHPHHVLVNHEHFPELRGAPPLVNTFHEQGVFANNMQDRKIGGDIPLCVWATSEKDGLIEGVYHPNHPIAGIMWHPERGGCDEAFTKKLIRAFVDGELFWKH